MGTAPYQDPLEKFANSVGNYFNPQTNNGQGFWSSPLAQSLGNIQNTIPKPVTQLMQSGLMGGGIQGLTNPQSQQAIANINPFIDKSGTGFLSPKFNEIHNKIVKQGYGSITPEESKIYSEAIGNLAIGATSSPVSTPGVSTILDAQTGDTLIRDQRYAQGNPNFKLQKGQTAEPSLPGATTEPPPQNFSGQNNLPEELKQTPGVDITGLTPNQREITSKAKTYFQPNYNNPTPAQQARISTDNPTGASPVQVRMPWLKEKMGIGETEAKVQDALDRYIPGNTSGEVLDNIPKVRDQMSSQISDIMNNNPKSVSIDDLTNLYNKNLNKNGVYMEATAPKTELQQMARDQVMNLYEKSTEIPLGNTTQSIISDQNILGMKNNLELKNIYNKIAAGSPLSDKELVTLSMRDTLDQTIASLHPDVKELTQIQSYLHDANPLAYEARTAEEKAIESAVPVQSFKSKILGNPWVQRAGLGLAIPTVAGAGIVGLNALNPGKLPEGNVVGATGNVNGTNLPPITQSPQPPNNFEVQAAIKTPGQQPQVKGAEINVTPQAQQTNINKEIPVDSLETEYKNIKPDNNGNFLVPDPTKIVDANGNPVAMNDDTYRAAMIPINQYLADNPNNPVAQQNAANAQSYLDNIYNSNSSKKIIAGWTQANKTLQDINYAKDLLNNPNAGALGEPSALDILQVGNVGIQSLKGKLNPNYRQLMLTIDAINNDNPNLKLHISDFANVETAKATLDLSLKKIISQLNNEIKTSAQGVPPITPPTGKGLPRSTQITTGALPPSQGGGLPEMQGTGTYQFMPPNPIGLPVGPPS